MPNEKLLAALEELRVLAEILRQDYRAKAYRTAIVEITKLGTHIDKHNLDRVLHREGIPGVGPGLADRITEFITRGHIAELRAAQRDPRVKAYRELGRIVGVGPATVERWYSMGIKNLRQLRREIAAGNVSVTRAQELGLAHYDDLIARIPRAEVEHLASKLRSMLLQVDPAMIMEVAGSYRRGSRSSGDIDVLVSNQTQYVDDLVRQLGAILEKDPAYIGALSAGPERMTFLYRDDTSNHVRQIDVLNVRYPSFYAALLYFTGSFTFNENMRGYAKAHGYRLNQTGLYKYVGVRSKRLELVPTDSEQQIFDILKLDYLPPEKRDGPLRR